MKQKVGRHTIDVTLDDLDVASIRAKTPVKTGQLRDGFLLTTDGFIINDVEYATVVEFGSVDKPGVFMVERSAPDMARRLGERIAKQIDQPGLIILPEIRIKVG